MLYKPFRTDFFFFARWTLSPLIPGLWGWWQTWRSGRQGTCSSHCWNGHPQHPEQTQRQACRYQLLTKANIARLFPCMQRDFLFPLCVLWCFSTVFSTCHSCLLSESTGNPYIEVWKHLVHFLRLGCVSMSQFSLSPSLLSHYVACFYVVFLYS